MDDGVQNGLQPDQWLPTLDKGEKRTSSLGSGALRFIRTRSSIRRELKRQCHRNKTGDSYGIQDNHIGSGGGGIGKWLREHLGGGSKGSHDINSTFVSKENANTNGGSNKSLGKTIYTSQNLYCSLPREHGRYIHNSGRKINHGNFTKSHGYDRPRSNSMNHHEKSISGDLGTLTRGGPIYGSEGRSLKKRNRDSRRYSFHETHDQGRHRQKSIRCSASWGATAYIYRFKPSLDVMEQMMENDVDGVADENNGERLYADVNDDHENLALRSKEFQEEEKEEAEAEEEEEENDIYKADESFIRDEELGEHDYEEERHGERSLEDEEIEEKRDIPSATISTAAEKPEEEVQEVIEPDHVLADIPVEIFANRETMIRKLKEFLAEQAELRKKNRLLEVWITKHMKKTQEKVIPTDVTKESDQMEQNYIQTLHTYKLHLDDVIEKRVRTMADMQSYEDKARKMRDENARVFDELVDREREVATGLIYAKTGRKITEKAVNEITRRQMSRREILARNRYEYIVLQHRFDEMKTLLQNLETLGEGMTTMDYETLYIAHVNYKDKLDERDREVEKLRYKIAEVVNGVAHYKEKETCLAEDIEFEERELDEYREQTARVREDVNKLHLILRDLRQAHDERRLEGGMLLAPPVLREMERMIKLLDALRNDIEIIKREIQQYGPANGRKRNSKGLCDRLGEHQAFTCVSSGIATTIERSCSRLCASTGEDLQSYRCIPDGGDVGYTMTELQPSPSGYRVQDEAPGPPSCPPGSYKSYASHGHGSEAANFKSAASYSQEGYGLKQSPPRPVALNEYYRRRNDGRRSSMEGNDHEGGKKTAAVAGYNDSHKKNTSGYKNDSGYSESLGFDSFTLPLNERDEASPPPTPPVRDASSLKGVCYGPGHEKYPSWPSAPERHSDEDIHSSGHSGSHRSKSWTDHTNYPKEKPAQYTRPHTKRPNPAFTQQLKTVMERCEKIPAETYESRNGSNVEEEAMSRLWPRVDREGKALGDAEYVVPSPPEREQQPQTLNHAELEAYVRSYQDPQVSQVDLYRETTLTQAGLEEYTRVQHSQQASYAQSEGYHSYVSSVDSTTNTPFLDRLRRDSEAVAQRPAASWEDTSREGRDSVVTTSSGSASSSETLKWHGSMSDVSVSSGMPPRQGASDRWHHGSMSDVSSVNGGILTQKPNNVCHEKWQSSMSDVSTSGMVSKGRYSLDKWQTSMNDRNKQGQGRPSLPAVIGHCTTTSASINDICQTSSVRESKWQESNIDDDSNERSQANQWDNSSRLESDKYAPQSPTRQQVGTASPQGSENWNVIHGSMSDVSQTNGIQCSKQLIAHSARVQTPQRHHSESVLYLDRERNQRKLYPVSTTQPQESTQSSRMTLSSPPQPQLSVAERINELEKQQQQQMRYTYLDPEKRHRVSDPTLKAIQKKALWSFYERHQASWRSEPQLTQGPAPAPQSPQSPPPQPPPRPKLSSSRRASSASDYASGTWRENVNRGQSQGNGDLPTPKHQHSNSCSSLSTDLLGPVIVGPAISIDDWVPERPPKKAHLRNAYNERMPSPDLPPPSPPTITESEVHDCDDPLPPPPPELSDDSFTEGQRKSNNSIHHQTEETAKISRERSCERHKSERHSMKRSKHNGKRDHDKSNGKSAPNSMKTSVQEQEQHQFVRSSMGLKHVDSETVLENGVSAGFATHRMVATGRSSLRYPSTQKLMVNGRIASTRRISEERPFSARPAAQLPDLISQRYSDSGNQRPAPQVPVEPRIIRQESMRIDGTRVDASGLLRNDADQRLESSSGQRPQPQVPKNADKNVTANPSSRPNYLSTTEAAKSPSKYLKSANHSFSIGNSVKTGYEASSKLFPSESNPQKYHEPPKYVPNHHQRSSDATQRSTHTYYALPPKYMDVSKQKSQSQCPTERYSTGSSNSPPPPLAPRQNTPGRKSLPPPPRPAPHQGSQSKASYLAYRRERGAPDSEGSYKRTMSPTSRMDDWPPPRDHDDPVLLRVTSHHTLQQHHQHHNSHHQHSDLSKSHSVDALHHRLEERCLQQQQHSTEVVNKLSHELSKKLQASDARSRTNENNNNDNLEDRHQHHHHYQEKRHPEKRHDYEQRRERLSPQSVEVLNDRNRQLERERRKLAASCEPLPQNREKQLREISGPFPIAGDDFFRERSATIEMTSKNIELLNRRNEKRMNSVTTSNAMSNYSMSTTTSSVATMMTTYDNGWSREHETQSSIEATIFSDRPPPPTSSPPRSPNNDEIVSPRGAVPRRTGSCSSSSSSGRSIDARVSPRVLLSRSPPKSSLDSLTRHEARIECTTNNRKVSSPTQTDNTGSWNRSNSPSRLSQTSETESRLERSSSRFKPGGRSSTSSISSVSKASSFSSPRNSPIEGDKSSPTSSLCVSPQPGIEGLTLVQRTEVVLRVNAATSDVASQTDILEDTEQDYTSMIQRPLPESRKKLPEEIECEELSKDLASQLSPNDKLVPILVPAPEHKKPTDYVSGLFRVETTLQPRSKRRLSLEESMPFCNENSDMDKKHETIPSTPVTPLSADLTSPLSPTSAYFTTSEGKARFLTRYSQDVTAEGLTCQEDAPVVEPMNSLDLRQKKEELMMRLDRKLVVLKAEQEAVREEGEVNEALGARVTVRVSAVARPPEASKYRNHVEEVGKITSLLLGLSGRLARAENALYGMPADHAERKILESKRDKLMDQLEEAKILKNNIDKRSINVSAILAKYLNEEEFADYQHFINMKAKLIVDGREILDKVKLGEEQLTALKEAID